MNADFRFLTAPLGMFANPLDPQTSWVPWAIILGVLVALGTGFKLAGKNKAARRGASGLGASVARLDEMLRPSRRHVHQAKVKRKRDEERGEDEPGK